MPLTALRDSEIWDWMTNTEQLLVVDLEQKIAQGELLVQKLKKVRMSIYRRAQMRCARLSPPRDAA